jgi:adenosine deaminase
MEFDSNFIAPPKCLSLPDLLTRALKGIALMQTEQQLRLVTRDLFEQLALENVIYAEIRFAPLLHTQQGLTPEAVVDIVDDAATKASEATGVEASLILCTLRHFTAEQSLQTVKLVERFRGRRVVALDIAGDEAGFPVDAHIPAFHHAISERILRTAHAGEARGATSVWETLKHFRPARIGHGVRSIQDPHLVQHLRERRIHLEVCPTCNVQTNIYDTYADHPVHRLYESGVSVGINTDGRTMSNVTLTREYEALRRTFGWQAEDFKMCNMNALEASFASENLKKSLAQRLSDGYRNN